MKNPWKDIALSDLSVMILGIAGGNGLEHIQKNKLKKVYGIDINPDYLKEVAHRYPELDELLECLCIDLINEADKLPKSDRVIANLLIEYIGYECFQKTIQHICPKYVSCIIQINTEDNWVSDSPYLHVFDELEQVHHQIEVQTLEKTMLKINYHTIKALEHMLPNGKKLMQIDFER